MLRNVRIGLRLHVVVLVILASVAVVAAAGVYVLRDRLMAERRHQSEFLVRTAIGQFAALNAQVGRGELSLEDAQAQALERASAMAWGDGYVWVNDMSPMVLAHPDPTLVGRPVGDFLGPDGRPTFREFLHLTEDGRQAWAVYSWPRPGGGPPETKMSFLGRFEPWGWLVGSGIYLGDVEAEWQRAAAGFAAVTVLAALAGIYVAWRLAQGITVPLGVVTRRMTMLAEGRDVAVPHDPCGDEVGDLNRAMAVFRRSLHEREEARREREAGQRVIQAAFASISDAIVVTDAENRIRLVNPAFTRITGYDAAEVIGRDPAMLASGKHDRVFYDSLWLGLKQHGHWQGEVWNRTKAGVIYPEWLSITAIRDERGRLEGYVGTFADISDRKRREARIRWRAEHDSLTGLANRASFEGLLHELVHEAHVHEHPLAVLFIDLDGFKAVNDRLGHGHGDKVLRRAAKRLRNTVRAGDLVARQGGDEFIVVLNPLNRVEDAVRVAEKIVASMGEPFAIGEHVAHIGASVGVAVYPEHADTPDTLITAADHAMYRAKQGGRGDWCLAVRPTERQAAD
jgi:diguanylate cyclase (GGDEF)-like protein/PAS domain S-box-containing protein